MNNLFLYRLMRTRKILVSAFFSLALSACIYVPVVNENDDESATCKTYTKSMSLDSVQMQASGRCQNQGCVALLAGAAAVTAGSAIISGSIVLTGNTLHWLEYQGTCSDGYLNKTKQLFLDSLDKGKPAG
jgi:hypothetical protein